MARVERDFSARSPIEQYALAEDMWCDTCNQPDLGFTDAIEYEEDGTIFVEGKCRVCGNRVVTKIHGDGE